MNSSRHDEHWKLFGASLTRREWLAIGVGAFTGASTAKGQNQTKAPKATIPSQLSQEIRGTSRRLIDQSRDSFERSLMPLEDHLEQLSVATNLNVRLAKATNQPDVERDWQAQQVRQLEGVAVRLERFRQPASIGWQADVFLARFSLADAQARLAKSDGNPELAAAAQTRAAEFARQHWAKRLDDSGIGHASAMQVWRATSLLNGAEGRPAGTGRDVLKRAVDATERWNFLGAGIGRKDLREAFEYELARVDLQESKPGSEAFAAKAQRAETLLTHLHETTTQFQSKGTASLFDVATTWAERSELHSYLQSAGEGLVPKTWKQRRESDLRSLQQLAKNTTDRRGRHAADTTYVEVLALGERTVDVR